MTFIPSSRYRSTGVTLRGLPDGGVSELPIGKEVDNHQSQGGVVMTSTNEPTTGGGTAPNMEQEGQKPEMCCDGQQTAEEHRANSPDGKCCIDK
jgi:hypothetical protein